MDNEVTYEVNPKIHATKVLAKFGEVFWGSGLSITPNATVNRIVEEKTVYRFFLFKRIKVTQAIICKFEPLSSGGYGPANAKPVLKVYGRVNIQDMTGVAKKLSKIYDTDIVLRLEEEEEKMTYWVRKKNKLHSDNKVEERWGSGL